MKFAIVAFFIALVFGAQASVLPLSPIVLGGGILPGGSVAIQAPLAHSLPIQLVTGPGLVPLTVPHVVTIAKK